MTQFPVFNEPLFQELGDTEGISRRDCRNLLLDPVIRKNGYTLNSSSVRGASQKLRIGNNIWRIHRHYERILKGKYFFDIGVRDL